MSSKKTESKQKEEGRAKARKQAGLSRSAGLSIFPTNIGKLSKEECAKLAFKPNGMADTVIQALQKHGAEAGEKRKQVVAQVKAKFGDASDSTIRTQVYRGIVYKRVVTTTPAGE